MKKWRIFLQIIIGVAIIIFILMKLDFSEVISVLGNTDILFFILACFSYLCLNFILSSRLFYLLTKIGYRVKFPKIFFSHMGGMVVGDITPGRSGYFLTPPILKKNADIRITDGMACIFAPQAVEFILKVAGAVAALVFISRISDINRNFIVSALVGVILLMVVGVLMLIISWKSENISSAFLSKIPYFRNFTENLASFKERNIGIKGSAGAIILLTMAGWFFAATQWFFIGKAIGINLPYSTFFLLHPLITILMFIPVSPAGLGLMEGGVIVVFSFFGIPSAQGLAFSVLVRVSILLVDLLGLKSVLTASK
ncbi:MAG: lysylphosphatidylglycerol synthase transmembrane domain-containing protein [Candidatus Methanoperedens sp.]|nr:lysylphosphatidylglycerol synthase transmembrane domain-containing protein [Candidatus Methanoperedens sp.]MCZ7404467.1 lysylphosphatidylglycerol synthase transmembrane domain-containing protein [Candidatus Methanoperedens sp.]